MTKIVQAKYKISRRHGVNLWGRVKDPINKKNYGPGQHGPTRRVKQKDYSLQLRAKQMLKGYYAMSEKQFARVYKEAVRRRGDTSENLVGLLECRLSAVVYRLNFAPTIFGARQLVSHGHIRVNGQKVDVGSYQVKAGDVIEVAADSRQIPMVIQAQESQERPVPEYFTTEPFKGTFVRIPTLDEIPYAVVMEPNLVIEFYSR